MIDSSMVIRHVVVAERDVVYFRGIFEASCGVATVFSEKGGQLTVAALPSRAVELDQMLADLRVELGATMWLADSPPE